MIFKFGLQFRKNLLDSPHYQILKHTRLTQAEAVCSNNKKVQFDSMAMFQLVFTPVIKLFPLFYGFKINSPYCLIQHAIDNGVMVGEARQIYIQPPLPDKWSGPFVVIEDLLPPIFVFRVYVTPCLKRINQVHSSIL